MKTGYLKLISVLFCIALVAEGCSGHNDTIYGSAAPSVPAASTAPAAPVNVTAIAGVRSLTVRWDSVTDANTYNLYYSTSPGVTLFNGIKLENISSPYTLTGLAGDTTYYVIVTSVKGSTESIASPQAFGTPHRVYTVIGSLSSDYGSAIAADKSGNLYTAGDTTGQFDGNAQTGLRDIFLIKYDIGGIKKWSRQIGAANAYSSVSGVAV